MNLKFEVSYLYFTCIVVILSSLVSCSTEEPETTDINKLDQIEIIDFKLLENSNDGVTVVTKIKIDSNYDLKVNDHGVVILKNNENFDKISLGALDDLSFKTTVSAGLVKGQKYSIYPYIYVKNTNFYGDTLDFESNVAIDYQVLEISPLQGFVNDTIIIKGKGFCKSSETIKSILLLEESEQETVFESDSLIKVIIRPTISKYKNLISISSCGLEKIQDKEFNITPFVIDSIFPKEAYIGDKVTLHGDYLLQQLSEVHIGSKKVDLLEWPIDKQRISFYLPEDLPSGELDLTFKMLDSTEVKTDFFQSTTPFVQSVDKLETGFMDTLSIKGNYFIQANKEIKLVIGGKEHQVYSSSKDEIKVILNRYFEETNPKLELSIGSFNFSQDLTMLPPQIIEIEKERYHFRDDEIVFKTKYFIPTYDNLIIGGVDVQYGKSPPIVEEHGIIRIDIRKWLSRSFEDFEFDENGEISIELVTQYGKDISSFKVYAPVIESVDPASIFAGDEIKFEGMDFGDKIVSKVYIDDIEIGASVSYNSFWFYTKSLSLGVHNVKIITGLQASNTVSFEILPIKANSFGSLSGTRSDVYTIYGTDLDKGSYYFTANGESMDIANNNGTAIGIQPNNTDRVYIKFNFKNILTDPIQKIQFHYAGEIKEIGTINTIEPYTLVEDYNMVVGYNYQTLYNGHFEYDRKLYMLNYSGIYEFNLETTSWLKYEDDMPAMPLGMARYQPSVDGDNAYILHDNGFQVYNLMSKTWGRIDFEIDSEYAVRGVVVNNKGYLITSSNKLIVYDLTDKSLTYKEIPFPISVSANEMIQLNGNIYLDKAYSNIFKYDFNSGTWLDLGKPVGRYGYDANLYEYNGLLYYSGGGEGLGHNILSVYDSNSGQWIKKVIMPKRLNNHAVIGSGEYLYFLIGGGERYELMNENLYRYNINQDPY